MPDDSRKNQNKGKHDAKEQRKPRQQRHQASDKSEKKVEKRTEDPKVAVPTKPVYEDPGPEFYKNLKRETDEILKITEEANSKYKKKEIQSNWTKYEMPIESYEEIEEQENLGADYEKLSQAPLSVGGHFQFKHEKSWDTDTGPSLYDKYFDINMENLATALSTIPFYERNCLDKTIFSETDLLSMENRSVKYKRKFYKDKSFTSSELEAQDNILSSIRENMSTSCKSEDILVTEKENISDNIEVDCNVSEPNSSGVLRSDMNEIVLKNTQQETEDMKMMLSLGAVTLDKQEDIIEDNIIQKDKMMTGKAIEVATNSVVIPNSNSSQIENIIQNTVLPVAAVPHKETKPVMESPEDLEKWLDDFLDG